LQKSRLPLLLVLPAIIVTAVIVEFPFLMSLYVSLTDWGPRSPFGATFIGIDNYTALLSDYYFWNSLRVLGIFAVSSVTLSFAIGMVLAFVLDRPLRGVRVLKTIMIIPMTLTPVVVSISWKMLYNPSFGLIDYLLSLFGMPTPNWLSSGSWALLAVVLVDVWQWTPFMTLIFLAGLQSLPPSTLEAAKIDGASWLNVVKHVTIPLLRPLLTLAVLFRMVDCLKTFDIIYALTKGGPGSTTETLNIYTFKQMFRFYNIGYAGALAVIFLAITMIVGTLISKKISFGEEIIEKT